MRINTAAYRYKFKDIQVQTLIQGAGGAATILQNGAEATAYGAEITSIAQITPAFSLYANLAYQHAEFDVFDEFAANIIGEPNFAAFEFNRSTNLDVAGNRLARTPEIVISAGASYVAELSTDYSLKLDADWYHNSGFFWDPSNQTKQEKYDVVNFSATVVNEPGDWSIQAWLKNAFDEYYFNTITTTSLAVSANEATPRTYGVTVTKNF